jgi:glycosyltransferase involved in cell wall biosynthesis
MDTPMISVIIPAYNSSATISRAIDSALGQTYKNYEIVVIDDGSTDCLSEALSGYPVRLFAQSNMGAAAARNHGSRVANGEFLAFLDADDFWHPDKLRQQVFAMGVYPSAKYCVTEWVAADGINSKILSEWDKGCHQAELEVVDFPRVFRNPYFGTPGVFMPKDNFDACGGFNENLTTAEDVDLWLRAAYGGVVVKCCQVLFYVVGSGNSLSAKFIDRTYADNVDVIDGFCRSYPDFPDSYPAAVAEARAKVYCDWGSAALSRGDFSLAREKLLLSLRAKLGFRSSYLLTKSLLSIN